MRMLLATTALAGLVLANAPAQAGGFDGFAGGLAGGIAGGLIAGAIAAQSQPYYVEHHVVVHHVYAPPRPKVVVVPRTVVVHDAAPLVVHDAVPIAQPVPVAVPVAAPAPAPAPAPVVVTVPVILPVINTAGPAPAPAPAPAPVVVTATSAAPTPAGLRHRLRRASPARSTPPAPPTRNGPRRTASATDRQPGPKPASRGLLGSGAPFRRIQDKESTTMKKALLTAVALATIATSAHAKVSCDITDTAGNALIYQFGDNTIADNGDGTMVETGFSKNGRVTFSPVGARPISIHTLDGYGGYSLHSSEAPGWALRVANSDAATLTHNGRYAGGGICSFVMPRAAAAPVGDQGIVD
jgi:hypothetical protein